jgi:hypothetical protein
VYAHYHGFGDGKMAELIRLAQTLPPDCRIVYFRDSAIQRQDAVDVMTVYDFGDRFTYIDTTSPGESPRLDVLRPPVLISYNLSDPVDVQKLESYMLEQHPSLVWQDSDRGESWSRRYFHVPG